MKTVFYTIIALQMLFLLGQTAMYQGRLTRGEAVYLKVVPYDPRSLFMGNYASLRYAISQVPVRLFPAAEKRRVKRGDTIYVGLTKGRPAGIVRASLVLPANTDGLVWLKGRVTWRDETHIHGPVIDVEYGLERFYVSERKGKRMDEANRRLWDSRTPPTITAVASVQPNGNAMLKDVLVNGKPLN